MNKIRIKNTNIIKKITKTVTNKKHGTFLCYETYTDDKLTDQYFTPTKPYHNGHSPKDMRFNYYGDDIDPVKVKKQYMNAGDVDIDEKFIYDLELFNDFGKLYCFHFGWDGEVYTITSKDSIPTPDEYELWESNFDLELAKAHLEKKKNVSDIKIEESIIQNWDITGKHVLLFNFQADKCLHKEMCKLSHSDRGRAAISHLGLYKFRKH